MTNALLFVISFLSGECRPINTVLKETWNTGMRLFIIPIFVQPCLIMTFVQHHSRVLMQPNQNSHRAFVIARDMPPAKQDSSFGHLRPTRAPVTSWGLLCPHEHEGGHPGTAVHDGNGEWSGEIRLHFWAQRNGNRMLATAAPHLPSRSSLGDTKTSWPLHTSPEPKLTKIYLNKRRQIRIQIGLSL